ncbi:MAG TPA: endonuclease/exonuclease/phosphatase family protein [Candidatus Binataceae bacterium]|nr:endonuclease/exonuclease/phosphatase family protein [Candidatus Binataceae bacterium]
MAVLEPIVVNRPALNLGPLLKVVAFNARGGRSTELLAQWLRKPPLAGAGLILLCELDWRLPRSAQVESAARLADSLELSMAFGPEFGFARHGEPMGSFFGNAILSAWPLHEVKAIRLPIFYDWTRRHLPRNPRWWGERVGQRGALRASLSIADKRITVAVAHLENRATPVERAEQMRCILARIPATGPAVLGGDLNTVTVDLRNARQCAAFSLSLLCAPRRLREPRPWEPLFADLERAGFQAQEANQPMAPTFTPTALWPRWLRPKLDWLAARELAVISGRSQVVSASYRGRRFSDHDAVMCEIAL